MSRAALTEALNREALRLGFHVRLAASLGWAGCAADGWLATRTAELPVSSRLLAVVAAAGVGAWAGALLGVLLALLVAVAARIDSWLGLGERLRAATSPGAENRSPVVRFHAWVATASLVGALAVAAFSAFLMASTRIEEEELRTLLIALAAAASIAGTLAMSAALLPLSIAAFAALDRRVRLPVPQQRFLRFVVYQLLPGAALALGLFLSFGVKLGVVMQLLGALLFLGLARATALGALEFATHQGSSDRGRRRARWARRGLGALAAVLAVGGAATLQFHAASADWVNRGVVLPFAVETLQSLSDLDNDGVSSFFGGRDCAPFDSKRSPARRDTPDDGVDENCDGHDAHASGSLPKLPVFSGALQARKVKRYNVLWYIVDSLRPHHLPLYGYKHNTSPALWRFGKQAWVFNDATSQSSNTAISVPSMFSGRWPGSLQWKRGGYPVATQGEHFIASILSGEGYYTALLSNHLVQRKLPGIQHGFQKKFVAPAKANWQSGEYGVSNAQRAMSEAQRDGKPFFIAVHVDDVHHPYTAHRGRSVPDFPNSNPTLRNYDRGIAVFDQAFSQVLTHLHNAGLWKNTIVIVTADHGEEFLEHGKTIHSRSCYIESVHVPLIIRVPGFPAARVAARVALVDLVPTLLELIGLEQNAPELDGRSLLLPVLQPKASSAERPIFCAIFQMMSGRQNFFIQSLRTERHTLIHEMLSDGLELYDTDADPGEHENLARDPAQHTRLESMKATLKASLQGNLFEARSFQ